MLTTWATQLFVANVSFWALRFLLEKIVFAIYELGRDIVFSILVLSVLAASSFIAVEYLLKHADINDFIQSHKIAVVLSLAAWTVTTWFWARYIFRRASNRSVFDHDVGAALVQLRY